MKTLNDKSSATIISRARIELKHGLKLVLGAMSFPIFGWRKPKGIRVLHYHRVNSYPFAKLGPVSREITVTPEAFEHQLAWLKKNGYRTPQPADFEAIVAGRLKSDRKQILITFDDGFEDNYLWAQKILLQYGFQAIFFITTDYIGMESGPAWTLGDAPGCGRFLSWSQINQMHEQGAIIASHSCSHRNLTGLNDEDLAYELSHSRDLLNEQLDGDHCWFAYPAGDVNERVQKAAIAAGYRVAFTTVPGIANATCDRVALPRTEISASDSHLVFRMKLAGLLDWTRFKERAGFRCAIGKINQILIRKIVES